jgi:alpha-2-macroglobulin
MLIHLLLGLIPMLLEAKTHFQPQLDHSRPHELVWSFPRAVKDWGKEDSKQVQLKCQNAEVPDYQLRWSNAQTLKLILSQNLEPGSICQATVAFIPRERFSFTVPLVKVTSATPWNFLELEEDTAFVIETESVVGHGKLADLAYVEVEGLSEKIELDAITDITRDQVLDSIYRERDPRSIVLKPRRNFPLGKSIVLVIPEGQTFAFRKEGRIRKPFSVSVTCERTKAEAPCSPLGKIGLEFNAPVRLNDLNGVGLQQGKDIHLPHLPDAAEVSTLSFPIRLKPDAEYQVHLPSNLKDISGRSLSNRHRFPLNLKTGPYPPLAKFPAPFGILESGQGAVLPVTVRNIEKQVRFQKTSAVLSPLSPVELFKWRKKIEDRQSPGYDQDLRKSSIFTNSPLATSQESLEYTASKNESEILGLPLNKKGLHLVELSSPALAQALLNQGQNFFVATAVLVTNMTAHMKIGETNALVWVTSLDQGRPVANARVGIYDCRGREIQQGNTNSEGYVLFDQVKASSLRQCQNPEELSYGEAIVIASKEDDTTFTSSSWDEGLESWRFALPYYSSQEAARVHTIFDRPLYQKGETVEMLHFLRGQDDQGLKLIRPSYTHLQIINYATEKEWRIPLTWKEPGTAVSSFSLPREIAQGQYQVGLIRLDKKNQIKEIVPSGNFRIEEFRVPSMKLDLAFQDQRKLLVAGQSMKLLGHLEYQAGGPATQTEVTLRGQHLDVPVINLPEYPQFTFRSGGISLQPEENDSAVAIEQKTALTDDKGDFHFTLTHLIKSESARKLNLNLEYPDPSGIFQSKSIAATVLPSNLLVGMELPYSAKVRQSQKAKLLFLDVDKKIISQLRFTGKLYRKYVTTNRKKILGGFYSYSSQQHTEFVGEVCRGVSGSDGKAECSFNPEKSGEYHLVIETNRGKGRGATWLYGDSESWEAHAFHDRMDILPDQKIYAPGEVAKLELKLPFEEALLLVTKERSGVREVSLEHFSRKRPFISVPITADDIPNSYISVLAVRGRLGQGQVTGTVDLAKPAYKLGLVEIKVSDISQRLSLELITEKDTFKVREPVRLRFKVKNQKGGPVPSALVAVSVYDEGLLIFAPHDYDVMRMLLKHLPHSVSTATSQTHVIGKRHFGLKARPHGGGGGEETGNRELFDTLIYWNPEVKLDPNGEAELDFPLNDSLTSFKIRAVAYTAGQFGHAEKSINSTQDLMTFNGTTPVVRTGDEFSAQYTLKNLTSRSMKLTASLSLNGEALASQQIALSSGESYRFLAKVPAFPEPGKAEYLLKVMEGQQQVDAIKFTQKIIPLFNPQVIFSDLKQINKETQLAGNSSEPRLAGVKIGLTASLLPSLESLQSYMRDYHFNCLEQQYARSLILEDAALLDDIHKNLSSYLDQRGLLKFFPTGHDSGHLPMTAHLLEVAHWNGKDLPASDRLESALARFVNGEIKQLHSHEIKHFAALKLRAMVALKLRGSVHFCPQWLSEVAAPSASESLLELMDKWVLFYPGERARSAHELLRQKMKIDGSTISLSVPQDFFDPNFLGGANTLMGRFLMLQNTLRSGSTFDNFFLASEGKFLRGYLSYRSRGHFGDTTANTYAYLLQQRWQRPQVTGTTRLADQRVSWAKGEAGAFWLDQDQGRKQQAIIHQGTGAPWADIHYLAWPDPLAPMFQGIELKQEVSPPLKAPRHAVQDRVSLKLRLTSRGDVEQTALRLHLPSGVTILRVETGDLDLMFEERFENEWRAYFSLLPKGEHTIVITFRLNQSGKFGIPGARIEALYSPEVFGQLPLWQMEIL